MAFIRKDLTDYLMAGDPSIKWQVQADILETSTEKIHYNRMHIELEGWGKYLLDLQGENGLWGESLMVSRYKSTLWILIALKRLGIYPLENFILPCEKLIDGNLFYNGGIRMEGTNKIHTCISTLILGVLSYFRFTRPEMDAIFHYLIEKQQDDGTWTCKYHNDPNIKFRTTLAALESLADYVEINPQHSSIIRDMRKPAHEFLLDRHLYKTSPDTTHKNFTFLEITFPYFSYDILTILDYFRKINMKYDPRMRVALNYLKEMRFNGKWIKSPLYDGEELLKLEYNNAPSRYNTLRAVRVLLNWDML